MTYEGKKVIIFILIISSFVVFVFASLKLLNEYQEFHEVKQDIEELKEDISIEHKEKSKINWEKLKDINSDIVGWIKIPNTKIDYPILKSEDEYYLNHSYKKEYNSNGSIFILGENLLEQKRTVIYGHNRLNGIMFSELSKYLDKDFFENHKYIYIYTPNKEYKLRVFSIYSINVFDEKENIQDLDFTSEIEYYKEKSKFKVDTKKIKKIIKLSTCSYLNNKQRQTEERYYIVATIE